jgi:DNA-binding protein H-NS
MTKINDLDKMSYFELVRVEMQLARLKIQKQNHERAEVRLKAIAMAKEHGFDIDELFGKNGKSKAAVKYRDPKNPENTWTGRGRVPLWLASAIKGGKAKREDFLI